MATNMPVAICKGDRVRLKDHSTASKYGMTAETVFDVALCEKVGGSRRLYVPHPKWPKEHTMLWARDCVLAWGRSSAERRKALGL